MPFTKAELEEMRLADEEIESEFATELAAYQREYREARKARTTACVQ